ncbi:MAG: class I SAM-dependent methyltransferase [Solirubrobacteraceae bacterium]
MEWFEDWFNSEYYHVLYKNRDQHEAEKFITNLVNHLKINKSAYLLDLACGKGRHAIFLNSLGFNLLGLDLSKNSITQAKEFENKNLHFQVHDMREVYKENTFDIVLNLFTSFGYFNSLEENLKVIKSIHTQLKPNGKLIIDFINAKKFITNLIPFEEKILEGINFKIYKKIENKQFVKTIEIINENKNYSFQEKVQALELPDFLDLTKGLFNLENTFGNYNLDAFNAENSDRLILEFQKK